MSTSSKEILKKFQDIFQQKPQLFYSPGRINLIGEHVDYNHGFVMPAAIDKGIWYAIAKNNTENINVYSADMNECLNISLHEIHKIRGWKNYILGVVDQLQKRKYSFSGFNAVFGGNLSVGAGMSSSAALECGLAFALNTIFNLHVTRVDIALICQKAEHTFPGVQCGIMDQFANMMGVKEHVLLLDCDSLEYETLPFNMKDYSIVLINSKVHHELAGGEYNKRRKQCEEGLQLLKQNHPSVQTFRDVKPEQVEVQKDILGEEVYMRCLYVTQEIQRTKEGAKHLQSNDMESFGKLMFKTHEGLRTLYNVSCTELDFLVDEAKQYPQIIGARLMGGGFGGCTINIIRKNNVDSIAKAIIKNYKKKFDIDAEYYVVSLSDGTHEITSKE
ncbi:MAG TPA: galactokinase [Chitinophagaceae bacterium]|jgi:galactokinase